MVSIADIWRLEQEGSAARCAGGFGILPFIADDEGMVQVEVPFEAGFDEQARLGFATGAIVRGVVRANHDVVERKGFAQEIMHAVKLAAGLVAAGQAGLVGGCDQDKTGLLEPLQVEPALGLEDEFLHGERCDLLTWTLANFVEDPVPFDEHCLFHTTDFSK